MIPTVSITALERHVPSAETTREMLRFASRILESFAEELGDHSVVGGQGMRRWAAAQGSDVLISGAANAAMSAGADPHTVLALAVETGRASLPAAGLPELEASGERAGANMHDHMANAPDEAFDLFYYFRDLVRDVAGALPPEERGAMGRWAAAFASALERLS